MFLKVSQNSQENSCAEVFFSRNFNKYEALAQVVSFEFCMNFLYIYIYIHIYIISQILFIGHIRKVGPETRYFWWNPRPETGDPSRG